MEERKFRFMWSRFHMWSVLLRLVKWWITWVCNNNNIIHEPKTHTLRPIKNQEQSEKVENGTYYKICFQENENPLLDNQLRQTNSQTKSSDHIDKISHKKHTINNWKYHTLVDVCDFAACVCECMSEMLCVCVWNWWSNRLKICEWDIYVESKSAKKKIEKENDESLQQEHNM